MNSGGGALTMGEEGSLDIDVFPKNLPHVQGEASITVTHLIINVPQMCFMVILRVGVDLGETPPLS